MYSFEDLDAEAIREADGRVLNLAIVNKVKVDIFHGHLVSGTEMIYKRSRRSAQHLLVHLYMRPKYPPLVIAHMHYVEAPAIFTTILMS